MTTGEQLYQNALQADRRYSETVMSRTGKKRCELTRDEERIHEIAEAKREKVLADEAWATFQRHAERCTNCGQMRADVARHEGDGGEAQCGPCWTAALVYGRMHMPEAFE